MGRIVVGLLLLAHGIGHSMGIMQVAKVATVNPGWDGRSWLLSDIAGATMVELIGVALWSIAMLGFVALAAIVFGWLPGTWWQPLALIASLASLAGLLLFPMAFPTFSTVGALVIDLAVLGSVVWYHLEPGDLGA